MMEIFINENYYKMKKIMLSIGVLGLLVSCGPSDTRKSDNPINEISETLVEKVKPDWNVYEGKIPCIDCEAIHMELWLESSDTEVTPDYRLIMNYENTPVGDTSEEVEGNYTVIAGKGVDRDAKLIQLNPGTNEPRYFVENDDRSITMLGEQMQPLEEEEELNYRLEIKETE